MARVAELLGVKVSTAGKRDFATPFTLLVFEAERVLPEPAWSPNLATHPDCRAAPNEQTPSPTRALRYRRSAFDGQNRQAVQIQRLSSTTVISAKRQQMTTPSQNVVVF
jgi:hypothetical protein